MSCPHVCGYFYLHTCSLFSAVWHFIQTQNRFLGQENQRFLCVNRKPELFGLFGIFCVLHFFCNLISAEAAADQWQTEPKTADKSSVSAPRTPRSTFPLLYKALYSSGALTFIQSTHDSSRCCSLLVEPFPLFFGLLIGQCDLTFRGYIAASWFGTLAESLDV